MDGRNKILVTSSEEIAFKTIYHQNKSVFIYLFF